MRKRLARTLLNTLLLSLLLHLLIVCFISVTVFHHPIEERKKSTNLYVPSYVYTGKVAPSLPYRPAHKQQPTLQKKEVVENTQPAIEQKSKDAIILKPKQNVAVAPKQNDLPKKSLLTASLDALNEETRQNVINSNKNTEPIYLVGEENSVSDPLIKLLGKALSAHFEYPRMAGEFGIEGRVIVRLTLHPEGHLSDIQMLESSSNRDLDAAALYAVNSAPTIIGADRFLSAPRRFVIGFIFRIQPGGR